MAFPTNPNDGDTYTSSLGVTYIYRAAEDRWDVFGTKLGATGIQGLTGSQGETGAGGGGSADFTLRYTFQAADFDNPNTSDWAVNALAPAAADSNNSGITVRLFDDTTEEGVGFMFTIPTGTTSLKFYFKSRAETTPGGAVAVVPRLYHRDLNDNAAIDTWSAGSDFTSLSFPTNENWQYDDQTVTLATLGLTAGELVQFELTRNTGSGSDTLTGDWTLAEMIVEPV